MSQYNRTISTQQSTEASSCRIYTADLYIYIYIYTAYTQITSRCPVWYKRKMNQSCEFKAIGSVYRKTREFKTDVCVHKSSLSWSVGHRPQSSGHFSTDISPHNPQHISALPTPMESRVGFCFGGFSGYKARLNVILSCDFGKVISLLASSS